MLTNSDSHVGGGGAPAMALLATEHLSSLKFASAVFILLDRKIYVELNCQFIRQKGVLIHEQPKLYSLIE